MITQIEDAKITGVTTSGAILLDAAGKSYRIELSQNCLLKLKIMIELHINRQDRSILQESQEAGQKPQKSKSIVNAKKTSTRRRKKRTAPAVKKAA